jgi:hypothetical protein
MTHARAAGVLLLLSALAAPGCAKMSAARDKAEKAAGQFHDLFNQKRFVEIYGASSPEFQKAGERDGFVTLLEAIHRKLGPVKGASTSGWQVNATAGGTYVSLVQTTTFETGTGTETFRYVVRGDDAVLVGYDIHSTELMIR